MSAFEVKEFIKDSLVDWPGKISAVVFLGGCNFRCPYCYNADLVLRPERLPDIELDQIADYLISNPLLDGVVVSGGEPTIHPDLPELIRWLRGFNLAVKLDTNGSNPEMLRELLEEGLVDYVAMDLKAPLDGECYRRTTGADCVEKVKESIEILMNDSVPYEFRTTVVPGLLTEEDVIRMAKQVRGARRYALQQFKPAKELVGILENTDPYPPELLRRLARRIRSYVGEVEVRL
jgi:pyruvate formate lyase activating enzyme